MELKQYYAWQTQKDDKMPNFFYRGVERGIDDIYIAKLMGEC